MSKGAGLQCERAAQIKDSPTLPPLTCRIGKRASRLSSLQADEECRLSKKRPTAAYQGGATPSSGSKEHSVSEWLTEAGRLLASQSGTHRHRHGRCLRIGTARCRRGHAGDLQGGVRATAVAQERD